MYLEHFGLNESPFRITPHTDFFFAGANRGSTLGALLYAIAHDEGIVKVTGEVGSGKTMLCRVLMERLPENVETVYIANPSLSRDDILITLSEELGVEHATDRLSTLLRALQDHLIEIYGKGKRVVVMIDEAHAMPAETLEEVRLLSNLESNRHKLLQIALFGQPELNDVLDRSDMRQLKERITHNFVLEPLIRSDIAEYIDFRMRAAGYRGPNVFTPAAVRLIEQVSQGLTRRINILCDKALLASFADATHAVDVKQVRAAVKDAEFSRSSKRTSAWLPVAGAVAAISLIAATAYTLGLARSTPAPTPQMQAPTTAPSLAAKTEPVAAASQPAGAQQPPAAANNTAPSANPGGVAERPAVLASPAPATRDNPAYSTFGPLTRERLAASESWLKTASSSRYFLQVIRITADKHGEIERFLAQHASSLDPSLLRVYHATANGKAWMGVIYGDYADQDEARSAARKLPGALLSFRPFPRQVIKLR